MTEVGIRSHNPIIIKIKSKNRVSIKKLNELYLLLSQEISKKKNSNNPNYIHSFQSMIDKVVVDINEILIRHEKKADK